MKGLPIFFEPETAKEKLHTQGSKQSFMMMIQSSLSRIQFFVFVPLNPFHQNERIFGTV